jgi:3-deoxy-D-manno-octulosonate 8-phosphate phosphatase (KDO 8-P phosphatase)
MAFPRLSVLRILPGIKGLILDVDGILTDGTLLFGEQGEEMKSFHVRDGHGLVLLLRSKFPVGIISGRKGAATERRMSELGIRDVFLGMRDKREAFNTLLARWNLLARQVAVMGDDVTDLEILRSAGLSIAVPDSHPTVLASVDWVTEFPGGRGAVREVADLLLFQLTKGGTPGKEDFLC